jgi:hypothetical protein
LLMNPVGAGMACGAEWACELIHGLLTAGTLSLSLGSLR